MRRKWIGTVGRFLARETLLGVAIDLLPPGAIVLAVIGALYGVLVGIPEPLIVALALATAAVVGLLNYRQRRRIEREREQMNVAIVSFVQRVTQRVEQLEGYASEEFQQAVIRTITDAVKPPDA